MMLNVVNKRLMLRRSKYFLVFRRLSAEMTPLLLFTCSMLQTRELPLSSKPKMQLVIRRLACHFSAIWNSWSVLQLFCALYSWVPLLFHINCGLLGIVQAEKKDIVGVQEQVISFGAGFCFRISSSYVVMLVLHLLNLILHHHFLKDTASVKMGRLF